MKIRKIMQSKKMRIGATITILVVIISILVIKNLNQPTITSYKDEQFFIYECSKPIKAKQGSVPDLMNGRMDALVPANQDEAKRYCKITGVE